MADNVGYTPGSGATVAADDVGGVLHQRVKLTLGADGVSNGDVSASNPIPTTAADGADATQGTKTDAVWDGVTNNPSIVSILKKIGSQSVSGSVTVTGTAASVQSGSWNVGITGVVQTTQTAVTVSQIPAQATLADGVASYTTPTFGAALIALNEVGTYDRIQTGDNNSDADAVRATGILPTESYLKGFNGTTWDRLRSSIANGLAVDVTRVTGTVTTTQGTVTVTGTAAAVQSGTWNVGVSGTVSTTQTGTVTVSGTVSTTGTVLVSQVGTFNVAQQGSVTVTGTAASVQSGTWNVTVTGTAASVQSGTWTVATTGTVQVTHGTVTVTGTAASIQSGTWNIGINTVGTVAVTATTKGTQTTNFIGVQQAKDSGRTHVNIYAVNASPAATTVETTIPTSLSFGVTNTVATTGYVIATGKTLRIEQITLGMRGNATTATIASATISMRVPATGGITITATPVVHQWRLAVPATTGAIDRITIPFPEGLEIPGNGARSVGFTGNATYVTNAPNWDVSFTGYEY